MDWFRQKHKGRQIPRRARGSERAWLKLSRALLLSLLLPLVTAQPAWATSVYHYVFEGTPVLTSGFQAKPAQAFQVTGSISATLTVRDDGTARFDYNAVDALLHVFAVDQATGQFSFLESGLAFSFGGFYENVVYADPQTGALDSTRPADPLAFGTNGTTPSHWFFHASPALAASGWPQQVDITPLVAEVGYSFAFLFQSQAHGWFRGPFDRQLDIHWQLRDFSQEGGEPIPEPSALLLLSSAVFGCSRLRKRS